MGHIRAWCSCLCSDVSSGVTGGPHLCLFCTNVGYVKHTARKAPTRDRLRVVMEQLSRALDCRLTSEQLSIALELMQNGVHPEALAALVLRLRPSDAEDSPAGVGR